ncbi:hypothetical protein [Actinomadura terrae]|uniref:hypothetical protein n=1 Tax=Actinomadura terrae TaxID=604353 RepID=UPI001FA6D4C0|nr:hypothetical protein [Actinomadura terrae]
MAQADSKGPSCAESGKVVSELRQHIDLTGKELTARAAADYSVVYSQQSWSAWKTGDRRVQPDALRVLINLAGSAPREVIERAERLLTELENESSRTASTPSSISDSTSDTQQGVAATSSPRRDGKTRAALVVGIVAVLGACAGGLGFKLLSDDAHDTSSAVSPTRSSSVTRPPTLSSNAPSAKPTTPAPNSSAPRPQSPTLAQSPARPPAQAPVTAPAPPSTCARTHYRVDEAGDVLNEQGDRIDRVVPGDIFIRDMSNTHPPKRYRYYGLLKNRGVAGYVMQRKLTPTCA